MYRCISKYIDWLWITAAQQLPGVVCHQFLSNSSSWSNTMVFVYRGDWRVLVYHGEFVVQHCGSCLLWGLESFCLPRWVLVYHYDCGVLAYHGEFLVHHCKFLFNMETGKFLPTTVSSWFTTASYCLPWGLESCWSTTESSYLPWGLGTSCLPRWVLGPPLRVLIYHGD